MTHSPTIWAIGLIIFIGGLWAMGAFKRRQPTTQPEPTTADDPVGHPVLGQMRKWEGDL